MSDGGEFSVELPFEFGDADESHLSWLSEVDLVGCLVAVGMVLSPLDGPQIQYLHSLLLHK